MLKILSHGAKGPWVGIPGVGSFSSSLDPIAKSLSAMDIGFVAVEIMEVFKGRRHLQSIGELADLIMHELPDLGSKSACTIVGHSFGGRIAYELGRRRSLSALNSHVIMIDALPRNLDGVKEPEGATLSDHSLLRWYISTFPPAFATKFAGVSDEDLSEALVSSRVFRRDDISDFTDAMRRQILAHNDYTPEAPLSDLVKLDVILPGSGSFANIDPLHIQKILNETARQWFTSDTEGDHYSILKMPDEILLKTS